SYYYLAALSPQFVVHPSGTTHHHLSFSSSPSPLPLPFPFPLSTPPSTFPSPPKGPTTPFHVLTALPPSIRMFNQPRPPQRSYRPVIVKACPCSSVPVPRTKMDAVRGVAGSVNATGVRLVPTYPCTSPEGPYTRISNAWPVHGMPSDPSPSNRASRGVRAGGDLSQASSSSSSSSSSPPPSSSSPAPNPGPLHAAPAGNTGTSVVPSRFRST
ncbi:hypothetical protein OF83DRAFT_1100826, partial [Amylostereum chailletii]